MNIGGIFAILDDIAATLDDVAVMTQTAAKKTAGVLGDDLAVNANQSSKFSSDREIPVLWAITKGSFINKLIILPVAFLLSAFAPWLIIPILMLGAMYLCFEGAEKIEEYIHNKLHGDEAKDKEDGDDLTEEQKVKKAITTDFILSIEIIVIALGVVVNDPLYIQVIVTSIIALIATVGVYGIVTLIVRADDMGLALIKKSEKYNSKFLRVFGTFLINLMPKLVRVLSVVGVLAMLSVGGSIFLHNIEYLHHFDILQNILGEFFVGMVAGFVLIVLNMMFKKLLKR